MPRYINADKLNKKRKYSFQTQGGCFPKSEWFIKADDFFAAPDEDVVEVKHGYWIEYQIPNIICCSECDWGTGVDEKSFKYCPMCGAKMDKKAGVEE